MISELEPSIQITKTHGHHQIEAKDSSSLSHLRLDDKLNKPEIHNTQESQQANTTKEILIFIVYFLNQLFASFALGMFQGTIPLLLVKNGAELADLGILTISNYPFALKFLFGPFLDRYFSVRIGKRMSYIIPCLYIFSIFSMYCCWTVDKYMTNLNIKELAFIGLLMVLNSAVLMISSDGYLVTMIHSNRRSYLSMLKQIAQLTGIFISYNVFIPLNSLDFSNKYLYSEPHTVPFATFRSFFLLTGICGLIYVFFVMFYVGKEPPVSKMFQSVAEILKITKGFWTNNNLFKCLLFILIWKFGFAPLEIYFWPTCLKQGFSEVSYINIITMIYPYNVVIAIVGGHFAVQHKKNRFILFYLYLVVRWVSSFMQYWMLKTYTTEEDWQGAFWMIAIWQTLSMTHYAIFGIATESLFAEACDSRIGSTYMTIFASVFNFGEYFPRTIMYFTVNENNWEIMTYVFWVYAVVFLFFALPIAIKLSSTPIEQYHLEVVPDEQELLEKAERSG